MEEGDAASFCDVTRKIIVCSRKCSRILKSPRLRVGKHLKVNGNMFKNVMYGKQVRGVERSTFVIAPDGTLAREWRGVKVPGHAQEVLDFVRTL